MDPLDLTTHRPRGPRETTLGFYFLPRTIDKLRAELPGGNMGSYLNHDTGFSAWAVRRLGLDMDEFRNAVRDARDESEVVAWLSARVDLSKAPAFNEKFETFVVDRFTPEDQVLVRERHPVMAQRAELNKILDVLEAEDERVFA
jgi:hypothetical protein